jgi:hypothetical protein
MCFNNMSNGPNRLTELRNAVAVYEREYREKATMLMSYSESQIKNNPQRHLEPYIHDLNRTIEFMAKLQMAYKECTNALERLVAR